MKRLSLLIVVIGINSAFSQESGFPKFSLELRPDPKTMAAFEYADEGRRILLDTSDFTSAMELAEKAMEVAPEHYSGPHLAWEISLKFAKNAVRSKLPDRDEAAATGFKDAMKYILEAMVADPGKEIFKAELLLTEATCAAASRNTEMMKTVSLTCIDKIKTTKDDKVKAAYYHAYAVTCLTKDFIQEGIKAESIAIKLDPRWEYYELRSALYWGVENNDFAERDKKTFQLLKTREVDELKKRKPLVWKRYTPPKK